MKYAGDRGDPYLEKTTGVLRNLLGIKDQAGLDIVESSLSFLRTSELSAQPVKGKFDLSHLQQIHKYLFRDIYEWAGQIRTVNINKDAVPFAPVAFIESYSKTLAVALAKEDHLKGLEKSKFVERLAHHYTEFNCVHPFREGNGRATREFIGQLALNAGYELDQTRIDNSKSQWDHASARGRAGNLELIRTVFLQAIRPARK